MNARLDKIITRGIIPLGGIYHMKYTDKQLSNHLHRIKGQLSGAERMINAERSCDEVVMQLMAARSSIERLSLNILQSETDSCFKSKKPADIKKLKNVASILFKYT